jgi:hypothetical protein
MITFIRTAFRLWRAQRAGQTLVACTPDLADKFPPFRWQYHVNTAASRWGDAEQEITPEQWRDAVIKVRQTKESK